MNIENLPLDKTAISNGRIDLLPPMHKAAFDEVVKAWPSYVEHDRASEVMLTLFGCNLVIRVGITESGQGQWMLSPNGRVQVSKRQLNDQD